MVWDKLCTIDFLHGLHDPRIKNRLASISGGIFRFLGNSIQHLLEAGFHVTNPVQVPSRQEDR
jgi:hypothetical protein